MLLGSPVIPVSTAINPLSIIGLEDPVNPEPKSSEIPPPPVPPESVPMKNLVPSHFITLPGVRSAPGLSLSKITSPFLIWDRSNRIWLQGKGDRKCTLSVGIGKN